jgi:hypothetical protein
MIAAERGLAARDYAQRTSLYDFLTFDYPAWAIKAHMSTAILAEAFFGSSDKKAGKSSKERTAQQKVPSWWKPRKPGTQVSYYDVGTKEGQMKLMSMASVLTGEAPAESGQNTLAAKAAARRVQRLA